MGGAYGGDAVRYFRAIPDCCRLLQAVAGSRWLLQAVAGCCVVLRHCARVTLLQAAAYFARHATALLHDTQLPLQ